MSQPAPGQQANHGHAQRGAKTLVVSGVLDPAQIEFSRRALVDFDLALVRLAVYDVLLRRRMEARGQYAEDWSEVLAAVRRHEAAGHGLPVVRADKGHPSEVAQRVLVARTFPLDSFARADEPAPTTAPAVGEPC